MELRFKNWTIFASRGVGAQQYDNLADVLLVSGDLPDGFQWTLLVGHEGLLDTVLLTEVSGSLRGTIPKDTLAYTGEYQLQLKGVSGELTKHTNVLRVMVPGSLSGDAQWPEVPSEFTQVEERIRELNAHPPIPGDDGYWYIWDPDSGEYKVSDKKIPTGPEGPPGAAASIRVGSVTTVESGIPAKVTNVGTNSDAIFDFEIPQGKPGGVTDFNGRAGSVKPETGDYTAEEVGAIAATEKGKPGGVAVLGSDGRVPNSQLPESANRDLSNLSDPEQALANLGLSYTAQQIDDAVAVLGASSTPQAALAALGAAVQENELDNAYFVGAGTGYGVFPVNQRGETEYSGVAPMFDRWNLAFGNSNSVTLTENGVSIIGGDPWSVIRQPLKCTLPVGATYSLSLLLHDGSLYTGAITIPAKEAYSQQIPIFSRGSAIRLYGPDLFEFVVTNGDRLSEIELIKLEPGNRQTAAYKKSDGTWAMLPQGIDYRQELAKCQAYFQLYHTQALRPTYAADCRPVMRIDPTPGTLVINGVTYYTNSAEL